MRFRINQNVGSPLWIPVIASTLFFFVVFGRHWVPAHDSLDGVMWYHQWLSNLAVSPGLSTWAPHLAWGQSMNLLAVATFSPSLFLLSPIAKILPHLNAVHLFDFAMLIDEFILLWGLYSLSGLLYKNRLASLFVCLTVSGTACWAMQSWWNFHFFYALPLAFFYLLRGAREARVFDVFLGCGIVSFTGLVGNLIYCAPMQICLALVFFASSFWICSTLRPKQTAWKKEKVLLGTLVLLCAVLVPVAVSVDGGKPEVLSPVITSDGNLSYDAFLDLNSDSNLVFSKGIFDGFEYGINPNLKTGRGNNSPYGGVLLLTFFVLGLLFSASPDRFSFLILAAVGFVLYLSRASFLAPVLYYIPILSGFKSFGMLSPFIKLMMVFVAGFGFDEMLNCFMDRKAMFFSRVLPASVLTLFISGGLFFYFYRSHTAENTLFYYRRAATQWIVILAALMTFARLWLDRSTAKGKSWAYVLLMLVFVDCYSYRACVYDVGLLPVSDRVWSLFNLRKNYYDERRYLDPRKQYIYRSVSREIGGPMGASVAAAEAFSNVDPCYAESGTDTVSEFLAPLFRKWNPEDKFAAGVYRMIGCENFPKIQVYDRLTVLPLRDDVEDFILSKAFAEPSLVTDSEEFLKVDPTSSSAPRVLATTNRISPGTPLFSAPSTLIIPARIGLTKFLPDKLVMDVTTYSPSSKKEFWLYYADAWHPFWEAFVNGKKTPILKANLGFKAVRIPAGTSHVEFLQESRYNDYLLIFLWFCSACLVMLVLFRLSVCLITER